MDALLLSRIQFGFVISFHTLFPAFTIGLASWLMFLEWRWLRTREGVWWDLYKFWSKVFAISFGMGVVSGIVMSFQFGTNWPVLSERAGNILGPLLSYEVLTAFFLEAGFLGVMLFGAHKVRPAVHFFCTVMVALGTLISTFWIIAAIGWMHTPQGHLLQDGVFSPGDWGAIVFNPSFPYRRRTWCWRPSSPPASSSAGSAPGTCGAVCMATWRCACCACRCCSAPSPCRRRCWWATCTG
jgi:cytochrome d ubiquinol oxidase subunit I